MAEGTIMAPADREQFSLHPEDGMTESLYHRSEKTEIPTRAEVDELLAKQVRGRDGQKGRLGGSEPCIEWN